MNSVLIPHNEARARAVQIQDGVTGPANREPYTQRAKPTQFANVDVEESREGGGQWGGASRSRYQIRRRIKRSLRCSILRFWRSLLTIIRSPIAIQRWIVVLFVIAALSTVIIDGISLTMSFRSLLEREIIVP